jgi:hypothetical protein
MVFVPEGQRDSSQARSAWNLFSAGLVARRACPEAEGARKLSPAQGLPWVSRNKRFALKGLAAQAIQLRVSSSAKRNLRRCVGSGLVFLRKGLSRFG